MVKILDKQCTKCSQIKPFEEFSKNKESIVGRRSLCKVCKNKMSRDAHAKNPEKYRAYFRDKAREKSATTNKRKRELHALNPEKYREKSRLKHLKNPAKKQEYMLRYRNKFPEKRLAETHSQHIKLLSEEKHHWSYNPEHYKDVFHVTVVTHKKIHRHIVYDQNYKMYRRIDTKELLDTKEKHLLWAKESLICEGINDVIALG